MVRIADRPYSVSTKRRAVESAHHASSKPHSSYSCRTDLVDALEGVRDVMVDWQGARSVLLHELGHLERDNMRPKTL